MLLSTAWTVVGLWHQWAHPVVGWLPLPVGITLAAYACRQASKAPNIDAGTRRFWRHLAVACGFYLGGIVANTVDAVGGPTPSQRITATTLVWYLAVLGIVLWALLRLPSWQRTRSDWLRFSLDACVVLVTSSALVWYFSLHAHPQWAARTGSGGAMLVIVAVGFISVATFVKVAFAGAGRLNRRAVHILAVGSAASTVAGSLTPFLNDYPYLSSTLVAVPIGALGIQLAAIAQVRDSGRPPRARRRSRWVAGLPYLAVVAMNVLLLATNSAYPGENDIIKIGAVAITVLVMVRQILVLRDNRRLLETVDSNLTALRGFQAELTHQASHDPLTGVANRTSLDTHLDRLLSSGTPMHVALLDLDNFKIVNDRLGHRTGDRLLKTISARLTETVGGNGLVARLGGDEFAVVLPGAEAMQVTVLLDRVTTVLRQPIEGIGSLTGCAASIGVTTSWAGDTPEELLRRADVAMYAAKEQGGNRLHWFDAAMDHRAAESARLGADLEHALARGEMFLLYQPIVELPSHRHAGVEVLLRWKHPLRGLIPPDVFIPMSEQSGLIIDIGRWVLENACRQATTWQREYGDDAPEKVSINVSARQLAEPSFVSDVEDILTRTGVDRSRLMLEITETAVLDSGPALAAVRELRRRGLRVALDDFGTGQSSLSLLLDCPVDVLKVDKSFVSGSAVGNAGAAIVEGLIGFTSRLHLDAVAEGVETFDQAEHLHSAGYRFAQGYLFGRPMPAEAIEATLARNRREDAAPSYTVTIVG
ncbi:bifunctional diguanylate cyclase/phosphodiesterase [Actinoplanes couchii]|uniref:Diguanylate cyclase/phosphodiesterase n=1 Tax=Actinoplanes couchii TaxID=403638 RepID=A0ABQ3XP36_9ACTN|nr:hypothetical protein Aco03nite_086750 [Actinoplanes couchii]